MKSPAAGRQQTIIQLVNEGHGVSIAAMAAICGVSTETIRRDLAQLERNGALQRVYGGAVPQDRSAPVQDRRRMMPAGKRAIGKIVAGLVQEGQWIFLTAGSTGLAIAEALLPGPRLRVMTTMPAIADALQAGDRHEVTLTGGAYDAKSGTTTGVEVLDAVADCSFDLAVIGIYGLDASYGLVEFSHFSMRLKRTLHRQARATICVGDHTKMGDVGRYRSIPFEQIETLVTDRPLFEPLADRFRLAGTNILFPPQNATEGPIDAN